METAMLCCRLSEVPADYQGKVFVGLDDDLEGVSGEVMVEIKKARNPKFHIYAMRLFRLVLNNQEKYQNMEDLLVEIKLQTGHYEEHITLGGKVIYNPKSISFAKMEEIEFKAFMSKSIDAILKFFGTGMDREVLEEIVRF